MIQTIFCISYSNPQIFFYFMKTIERLRVFLEEQSISKNDFDKRIGASNGYIGKQIKNSASIGTDVIEKIISIFPQLNIIWLLTGEGPMLLEKEQEMTLNDPPPTYEAKSLRKLNIDEEIACLKKEIQMLEQIVALQKKVIDNYEQCHEVSAKSS